MNKRMFELLAEARDITVEQCMKAPHGSALLTPAQLEKYTKSIIRECIDKIETHQVPVGNSAAGEMACEWTYSALMEIRDEIKQHFGVEE
jgi:hypothetical protein